MDGYFLWWVSEKVVRVTDHVCYLISYLCCRCLEYTPDNQSGLYLSGLWYDAGPSVRGRSVQRSVNGGTERQRRHTGGAGGAAGWRWTARAAGGRSSCRARLTQRPAGQRISS